MINQGRFFLITPCLVLVLLLLMKHTLHAQNCIPNANFEKNAEGNLFEWEQPKGKYHHYQVNFQKVDGKLLINSYPSLHLSSNIPGFGSEYLVVKLTSKLVKGQQYMVQMKAFPATLNPMEIAAVEQIQWKFMETPPVVDNRIRIYEHADISFPLNPQKMITDFTLFKQSYMARGNEVYLVIGRFFTSEEDSVMSTLVQLKEHFIEEKEAHIKEVNDSFISHYPPLTDFKGKKKQLEAFNEQVNKIEQEKLAVLQEIEREYKQGIDTLNFILKHSEYNILTGIDDVCLAPIDSNGNCSYSEQAQYSELIVGNTYRLSHVNFESRSFILDEDAKKELDYLAEWMKQHDTRKIKLTGHTDNIINTAFPNLQLSRNRAKACVDYLISKGVAPARLSWEGFGAEQPLADNDTDEGRKENRRVEFILLP